MARTPSKSAAWIDITMEFGHAAGTWPGDAVLERSWTSHIATGPWGVNLSRFSSSPHNGTHSDAPYHVDDAGAKSESLPIDPYIGPCRVVDVTKARGEELPASLADAALRGDPERILLKTRTGPLPKEFPRPFKALSEALAKRLAAAGLRLVGTDAPSIDAFDASGLKAHRALFAAGVVLLENLDLERTQAGEYELVALPLKVAGLCGAPVRAVLRPLP